MSEGVYLTPFKDALQWAANVLSDGAFKTFLLEFSHVDNYGCCFAGFRRLGALGRHDLTCIYYEMQEIMAHDLIRLVEDAKRDGYGRWSAAVYQINPYFLYLRPECFEQAVARWNSIEQTVEQKVPVFGLNSIVSIESTESAPTGNASILHQQATPENSSSSRQRTPESVMPNAGEIAHWQRQKQSKATQRQQASSAERKPTKTDVPPPRPAYPAISPMSRPLSMSHEEELALMLKTDLRTTVPLARGLIVTYGYQRVTAALQVDFVRSAKKPFGALRHLLEIQKIEAGDGLSDSQSDDGIIR